LDTRWSELSDEDVTTAAPQVLADLMNIEGNPRHGDWRSEELGEVLRHQLEAPLVFDLGSFAAGESGRTTLPHDMATGEVSNFGALFLHPNPPLPLLQLTKRFAKTSDRREANPLPAEVAMVLYYAAIVAARLRHDARISRMSEQTLAEGTAWVLLQEWVTPPLRDLFVEAQARSPRDAGTRQSGLE
jgi:hypothetical protein